MARTQGRVRGTADKSAEYTANQELERAEKRERAGQALQGEAKPKPVAPARTLSADEVTQAEITRKKEINAYLQRKAGRPKPEKYLAHPDSMLGQQQRGKR